MIKTEHLGNVVLPGIASLICLVTPENDSAKKMRIGDENLKIHFLWKWYNIILKDVFILKQLACFFNCFLCWFFPRAVANGKNSMVDVLFTLLLCCYHWKVA